MLERFYASEEQFEQIRAKLKLTPCPHCKTVGTLNRHGVLRGYDECNQRQRTVRAHRVFCNNRKRANGCGRTFSIWAADKIRRLSLTADALWAFLKGVYSTGNKLQAMRSAQSGLSDSAPYRIWKRIALAQSALRTVLAGRCKAPRVTSTEPTDQIVAHLQAAFPSPRPIVDFQLTLQSSFL